MNKISQLGVITLLSGLGLLIFKGIGIIAKNNIKFPDLTIIGSVSADSVSWVDDLSFQVIKSGVLYLLNLPLFLWLIYLGVIFLIIGSFTKS